MSKAVLLSIKPNYCDLIASGKKTIEVRKTKPIIQTPFKCYIYCTKDKHGWFNFLKKERLDGKVIGEFICDTYVIDRTYGHDPLFKAAACIGDSEAAVYCTNLKTYGWHILDLKIYDKPIELNEFYKACNKADFYDCSKCEDKGEKVCYALERAPQSWCYVEEI